MNAGETCAITHVSPALFTVQKLLFSKNEVTTNLWVWGALIVSLVFTFAAYFIKPIANALALEPLKFNTIALTFLFALGAIFVAQIIKYVSLFITKESSLRKDCYKMCIYMCKKYN